MTPARAQVQLSIPELKGASGASAVVPVVISEGKDIAALQFAISFDPGLITPVSDDAVLPGSAVADHGIGVRRDAARLNIVVYSSSLSGMRPGSAAVVQVVFRVAAGAPTGASSPITLSAVQASDIEGNAVTVTPKDGRLTVSSAVQESLPGANDLVFPHVVNGSFPGGSFATSLLFVSRTGTAAGASIRFFKSDGSALAVRLIDGRSGSEFPAELREGGSVFLQTDGTGELSAGYVRVSASGPLGGTVLFGQSEATGRVVTETAVGTSPSLTRVAVPVLFTAGEANTGIAFANPSSQSADILLFLRETTGALVAIRSVTLEPGRHLAKFATEYFEQIGGRPSFQGTIEARASVPVFAVALKQQGALLTTFPVIETQ